MKTFFPDNNLPPQAQDWVIKLEREINALKKEIASAASVKQIAQVVQEVRSVRADTVSLKESASVAIPAIVQVQEFSFNIDGGRPGSMYSGLSVLDCGYFDSVRGGIEPLDGGRL